MKNHAKRGVKRHSSPVPPFPGPSQGRFRMARHQLTGGGGIAFQRSGVGDWVALLSKGFTQRHHQSTHFSFFRGHHGITMGEQGGYRDGVHRSASSYFIFSLSRLAASNKFEPSAPCLLSQSGQCDCLVQSNKLYCST